MAIFKCKMCGGTLEIEENTSVCECEYCGSKQTLPSFDDDKKIKLFDRANRLRFNSEFDKAAGIYESIIEEFPEEAEAYWGNLLCKYGIEYVDDPATRDKVPTCHRSSFESFMDEDDFEMVMENSDTLARAVYREQAKEIEEIRKGIIEVSGREEPYDIFICYKETDENGQRTLDSVLAQDVYDALTEKGYRVFFSRITLEDKLGTEYEPYIFAALNSAKIMLAFGTSYDFYNAVWVKNEWSRYLKLMAKDKTKHLIPCFKGIDAYDMPKEFARLTAQDLGKVGATQDLLRGIEKLIGKKEFEKTEEKTVEKIIVQNSGGQNIEPLLKRAFMFLEDGEWKKADGFCEKVLDLDPENALAYLGKLMAELKVKKQDQLSKLEEPFDDHAFYEKAIRFADGKLKTFLQESNLTIFYNRAIKKMHTAKNEADYSAAAQAFRQFGKFKDADTLAEECSRQAIHKKREFENTVNAVLAAFTTAKDSKGGKKSLTAQLADQRQELNQLERLLQAYPEICEKISNGYLQIQQLENEKKELDTRFSTLGIFARKEKRSITDRIENIRNNVSNLKKDISNLESQKKEYDSENAITTEISKIKIRISELNDSIAAQKNSSQSKITLSDALKEVYSYPEVYDAVRKKNQPLTDEFVLHVCSNIEMGKYGNGVIEWRVLDISNGKALLISKEGIDVKPYNKVKMHITWTNCTLRTWLNNEFYNSAFSSEEKRKIIRSTVLADKNPQYDTDPGNNTEDYIFLLSATEAVKYLVYDEDRSCKPTDVAKQHGAHVNSNNGNCWWWLRSPGCYQDRAAEVLSDSSVYCSGRDVSDGSGGVRPALWINLDS